MLGHTGLGQPNLAAVGGGNVQALFIAHYMNMSAIYSPIAISLDIAPALWTDPDTFYAPTVAAIPAGQVSPERFVNINVFYAPFLTLNIAPALWADPDTFYAPTVTGELTQSLHPFHFQEGNVFWEPRVTAEPKEPTYDYPVGRGLYSDYGIRASMTMYKKRLVIGIQ